MVKTILKIVHHQRIQSGKQIVEINLQWITSFKFYLILMRYIYIYIYIYTEECIYRQQVIIQASFVKDDGQKIWDNSFTT